MSRVLAWCRKTKQARLITSHHMKYIPTIAGGLLGLLFIMSGLVVLLKLAPMPPPPPEGTPPAHFMAAFVPTGYLTFVKVFEVLGGVLVAIPRTRNWGLLILGPIIVNILAFHGFVTGGAGLLQPTLIIIVVLAACLLWCGRRAFLGLLGAPKTPNEKV
jgi:hypothetical protein